MTGWPFARGPTLVAGSYGPLLLRRSLRLSVADVRQHAHVIGASGSGKSRFLAGFFLGLLRLGLPATLIDPHGDLARLVLAHLVARGVYTRPEAFERILYLDLPAAERRARFLPFNVFRQYGHDDTIAANVKEAFHRAWPELAQGAATFDTLLPDAVLLLLHNALPITQMQRLLIDAGFRERLLAGERDADLVSSFRNVYDGLRKPDQIAYAGSVLRRARQLTQLPVLKYGLAQEALVLDYRRILAQHQAVIVNLALPNPDARRLLGCLLTVGAEQGALSRADLAAGRRFGSHHLVIDEFPEFTAQSEQALARMLSLCRKFGLFLVLAHQNWSQTSARLRGAIANVGLELVFRLGREDAEYTARLLGQVDPRTVRQDLPEEDLSESAGMAEQRERFTQELQDLPPRAAYLAQYGRPPHPMPWRWFVAHAPRRVVKITTLPVPDIVVDPAQLAWVEEEYLQRYFHDATVIEAGLEAHATEAATAPRVTRQEVVAAE